MQKKRNNFIFDSSMKKIWFLSLLMILLWPVTFLYATEISDAVQWGHSYGLTKYENEEDFMQDQPIRRDEITKFLVKYNDLIGIKEKKTDRNCEFTDLNLAWEDTIPILKDACYKDIMHWYQDKIMPNQFLTNEETITMIVRIVIGNQSEVWGSYRSENYYKAMKWLKVPFDTFLNREKYATRGEVIKLLYRVYQEGQKVMKSEYEDQKERETFWEKLQKLLELFKN